MSFSSDVKKEIGTINNLAKKEQVKHELIGYLISSNCEINENKIKYATESDYNINRFSKVLANLEIEHDIEMNGKLFVITSDIPKINEIEVKKENIEISDIEKLIRQNEENKKVEQK